MLEIVFGTALVASPVVLMFHDRIALAGARMYLGLRHRDTHKNIARLERELGIDDETLLREAARIEALALVERNREHSRVLLADRLHGPRHDWQRNGDGFLVGPERLNFAPAQAVSAVAASVPIRNLVQVLPPSVRVVDRPGEVFH